MSEVARLERAAGGPFTYVHRGEARGLPSPLELPADEVRQRLHDGHRHSSIPRDMPEWKARALFDAWRDHFDLPDSAEAERLVYTLDRWPRAAEADLHVFANGADVGELWRSRRWRLLMNLIDHLPGHSHLSAAMANDEEHAARLAEYLERDAGGEEKPDQGPPLHRWTPEVSMLAEVIDAVNQWGYRNFAVAAGGGQKAGPPPKAYVRPKTALALARERAVIARKRAAHESLTRRLLPHKRG